MSEYQRVAFRAIDAPVSKTNLEFMRQQSSRAEITPWSFDNEYHFGDFHGDAVAMLRRGYDFHFHYAGFGIRKLMIRLPNGLPDAKAAAPYLQEDSPKFLKDKQGPGGILVIEPNFEPGSLDDLWDFEQLFGRLISLRAEILAGDLRPFYLAHLVVMQDGNHDPNEEEEAPVPAGLDKPTDAQRALGELYGVNAAMIAAAARNCPPMPQRAESKKQYAAWLRQQPDTQRIAWLEQLMDDPGAAVRREMLAEFQKSQNTPSWPTVRLCRSIAELKAVAEGVQAETERKDAERSTRQRAKKLADMLADPTPTLRKTEELVSQRNTYDYEKTAELLADLREAIAGTERSGLADQQARKLKEQNPTLTRLTAALRRKGFLKK